MRKVGISYITCVQVDEQTHKARFLIRIGDIVWVTDQLNIRPMTDNEMKNKDHEPER